MDGWMDGWMLGLVDGQYRSCSPFYYALYGITNRLNRSSNGIYSVVRVCKTEEQVLPMDG